uniref:Protein SPT2 homolog n=1 Tax=Strongyloides papillosus TaxID=174720 RepID=A0A0N5C0H0_STREA
MDDLLGEILGQVQATKKTKPVVKEYKSAKRLAEEREIAQYEAERKERSERNRLFEMKAKERALDARIREAVKKNKGRVTARMAKEFGMDLLVMQERYGSDVDVLKKLQSERERDSITTDWQCDKFAHGAIKAQKLREQLAKNGKITAAAKVSKKAINFDEMKEDLTSREKKSREINSSKEKTMSTKISQGQNLSFIDILKQAKLNKSEQGEASKQKEKVNKVEKTKVPTENMKTPPTRYDSKEQMFPSSLQKVDSKQLSTREDKKQCYDNSKKNDIIRHKNTSLRDDSFKKTSCEKDSSQNLSRGNISSTKISKIPRIPSLPDKIKSQTIKDVKKPNLPDIFKRPSEKRKEMKEVTKTSLQSNGKGGTKSSGKESGRKSDIEMDKFRALEERERKKQEIFKAMREVEMLRNKGSELFSEKKHEKKIQSRESNYYKGDKSHDNGRKRSHGIYDDYNRKKNKRSYDEYEDDYDSEDSLADFIDDDYEEEVPDRKTMKEALRGIAKNYDRARWRENERRISDRDMVSSFREIDREERLSLRIGYKEDLEEAKKGSDAL